MMTSNAERLKSVLTPYPQSRVELAHMLGMSDSELRLAKGELIDNGVFVCSSSGVEGYWLGSEEERKKAAREMRAKAYTLLERANKLEPIEILGQERWAI